MGTHFSFGLSSDEFAFVGRLRRMLPSDSFLLFDLGARRLSVSAANADGPRLTFSR